MSVTDAMVIELWRIVTSMSDRDLAERLERMAATGPLERFVLLEAAARLRNT